MANGMKTAAVYLDFQKTFDSMDRRILLMRLQGFGTEAENSLSLFASYANCHDQKTYYEQTESRKTPVVDGVLQGSVQGLPLFLVCILPRPPLKPKICGAHENYGFRKNLTKIPPRLRNKISTFS